MGSESILEGIDSKWKILDEEEDGKRWETLNKKAEQLTKETYENWKEELHNLLIFAGLFSAVVTAFTIEAGKTVQGDPADTTVLLLHAIALLLNNQTHPQASLSIDLKPVPTPSVNAQWINVLYSISLILSLTAVLGGIVCLQWLRAFGRDITGVSHKEDLSLQYQRHKGLRSWGVLALLNALPLLLLVALCLFFTGFMVSQWESDTFAAVPVTLLVAISGSFILVTSVIPAGQVIWLIIGKSSPTIPTQAPVLCPYRSSQAWLFHLSLCGIIHIIRCCNITDAGWLKRFTNIDGWKDYDTVSTTLWKRNAGVVQSIYDGLVWISREYRQTDTVALDAYFCLLVDSCYGSWMKLKKRDTPWYKMKWDWENQNLLACFGIDINCNTTEVFTKIRVKAAIDAVVEWNRSDFSLKRGAPWSDISALEKTVSDMTRGTRRAFLEEITTGLKNPENAWITEEVATVSACLVMDQDSSHWNETIPILDEVYKRHPSTLKFPSRPIHTLCDKLRDKLSSEHDCDRLVLLFNKIFPHMNSEHLDDFVIPLGWLLVSRCECAKCFIGPMTAEGFLKVIEDLALQGLIAKEQSLDNIFLYTAHLLEHSWGLLGILPSINKTLNVILSAAETHVQNLTSMYESVLHPNQFTIPRTIPDPDFSYEDLQPVWDLTDNFNKRLKDIWDSRPGLKSMNSPEVVGHIEGNREHTPTTAGTSQVYDLKPLISGTLPLTGELYEDTIDQSAPSIPMEASSNTSIIDIEIGNHALVPTIISLLQDPQPHSSSPESIMSINLPSEEKIHVNPPAINMNTVQPDVGKQDSNKDSVVTQHLTYSHKTPAVDNTPNNYAS